ncbi:MAG: GTP-binding protein [Gemmatimonadota bacterium]
MVPLEHMDIVVAGHVDHGKSTVIGRLLADTHSLPDGRLEQVRATCARNAKPFEYAFLLDALKDEQAQGITIDSARVFFRSERRHYIIIDAPGHVEFLKNMVSGAARAEAALLVVDAAEGVRENSRRHGYLLSMLGIRQVAVLVNKMDLVRYDRAAFERLRAELAAFLAGVDVTPGDFIPVAAREGDNIAARSVLMPWYHGPTVLEALDAFRAALPPVDAPFRMPVQDVYRFTADGDGRRIIAGTIDTGRVRAGDEVVFYPSGKKSRVRSIEAFDRVPPAAAAAGWSTGLTLEEQIYVTRGEVATLAGEPRPDVTTRLRVNLFWLGRAPLERHKDYILKLGTARVPMRVEAVHRVLDAATLASSDGKERVDRHDVAECTLHLARPIAFDATADLAPLGRFVIVDAYEIAGGGIVREALEDRQARIREGVLLRNRMWEPGSVTPAQRAERFGQRPALVLVTGARDADRKTLARALEARLFAEGRLVYFLGIANVLYGVDADISRTDETRREHIRRLAEVAHLLVDTGAILLVTAIELTQDDLDLIGTAVGRDCIQTVWVGDRVTTDLAIGLRVGDGEPVASGVDRVREMLRDKGVIGRHPTP